MSYTTSGIENVRVDQHDWGLTVRARNTHADKVVQCYVSGRLADFQSAPSEAVEFDLEAIDPGETIALLAVGPGEAGTDYWEDAFGASGVPGNRIRVATPQTIAPYGPSDQWRVYLGSRGAAEADTLVHQRDLYPGGRRACGFGAHFGAGGFGWDGPDAIGFGRNFGLGEFGFDCEMISWTSDPLPPGAYPVKVAAGDDAGNESAPYETIVTLDGCARPASGLAIQAYEKATDTLTLSFTPSEDLN